MYIAHSDDSVDILHDAEVGLVLNLTGEHRVSGTFDGSFRSDTPRPNSVTVMPPGVRFKFSIEGRCRILALHLPLNSLVPSGGPAPSMVRPHLNKVDPILAALVWRAVTGEEDARRIAADALAAHLTAIGPLRSQRIGGIAPAKLRRIFDIVEADVGRAWRTSDLAAAIGVSAYHFTREFTRMTGQSPQRYIMSRRVARAIPALLCGEGVEGVAYSLGFSSSSHLCHHVRKATGATVRQVRGVAGGD
jgi:AraC-like DNA-binding protein